MAVQTPGHGVHRRGLFPRLQADATRRGNPVGDFSV